jgi:hypothetical protein
VSQTRANPALPPHGTSDPNVDPIATIEVAQTAADNFCSTFHPPGDNTLAFSRKLSHANRAMRDLILIFVAVDMTVLTDE